MKLDLIAPRNPESFWTFEGILPSLGKRCVFPNLALRASPRRAWLTLSLCVEAAWRRPRAIREALTLALMHKHFYEYVRDTSRQLEALIGELRESEAVGPSAQVAGRTP
jgi:hypothetical protein